MILKKNITQAFDINLCRGSHVSISNLFFHHRRTSNSILIPIHVMIIVVMFHILEACLAVFIGRENQSFFIRLYWLRILYWNVRIDIRISVYNIDDFSLVTFSWWGFSCLFSMNGDGRFIENTVKISLNDITCVLIYACSSARTCLVSYVNVDDSWKLWSPKNVSV